MNTINRRNTRPYIYENLIRLGEPNADGGYVVPSDLIDSSAALLSLGLGSNWTFDYAVKQRNPQIRVIGVDHSVSANKFKIALRRAKRKAFLYRIFGNKGKLGKYLSKITSLKAYFELYHNHSNSHIQKMVAPATNERQISINDLIGMLPGNAPHDIFIKMDIEGSEYAMIDQIMKNHQRIDGLAIEFHHLDKKADEFNLAIDKLNTHFRIVHIHGNNCTPYCKVSDFPSTVEVTFVHKAKMPEGERLQDCKYPRPDLDTPSTPKRADYQLSFD